MTISLMQLSLVFCPYKKAWIDTRNCHFCNCTEYPGRDFRCNVDDEFESNKIRRKHPGQMGSFITTEKLIQLITEEDKRVRGLRVRP